MSKKGDANLLAINSGSSPTGASPLQRPLVVTLPLVLLIIVLIVAAFFRFNLLGAKAYHHDESIHAYYSWKLWTKGIKDTVGDPSHYDPVYHGPLQYQINALFFALFGDSDFTGRSASAAVGMLCVILAWLLFRDRDPDWTTGIIAAGIVAISPTLTYFARFTREDVHLLTWNLGMALFAMRYFSSRKIADFLLMCLFLIFGYATKESSYMSGAMICGFAVMAGVWLLIIEPRKWMPRIFDEYSEFVKLLALYGLFSVFMFLFAAWYEYSDPSHANDKLPDWSYMLGIGKYFMSLKKEGRLTTFGLAWWIPFFILVPLCLFALGYLRTLFPSNRPLPGENSYRSPASACVAFALLVIWVAFMLKWSGMSIPWILLGILLLIALTAGAQFLFGAVLGPGITDFRSATSILRSNVLFLYGLLVIFFLYCYFFTTVFHDVAGTAKNGMIDGVLDYLTYWFKQQFKPRLLGPPSYWVWRIFAYEPVLVYLSIWAVLTVLAATVQNLVVWNVSKQSGGTPPMDAADRDELQPDWSCKLPTFQGPARNPILGPQWLPYVIGLGLMLIVFYLINLWCLYPPALSKTLPPALKKFLVLGYVGMIGTYLPIVLFFALSWQIVRERMMYAFLIFWSFTSIWIYSGLEEKAPWLIIHQTLPMALLSALFLGDYLRQFRIPVVRYLLLVPVAVGFVYSVHATSLVCFQYPDDPREMLVYTQTDPKMLAVLHEMEDLAMELGQAKDAEFALQGEANWPATWYLRNYPKIYWSMPSDARYPMVIVDEDKRKRMERVLGDAYYIRQIPIRSWWQPELTQLREMHWRERWRAIWEYLLHRKTWSQTGSQFVHVYRKYDPFERLSPASIPEIPFTYQTPRQLRTFGSGMLNEPRGVAFAGGKLYVADSKNGRVMVFSPDGTQLGMIPSAQETNPGAKLSAEWFGVGAVAADAQGNVFVADTWAKPTKGRGSWGRIVKFSPEGRMLLEWELPNGFFAPRGITVTPQGQVWVVDTGNRRVQVFDTNGNHLETFGAEGAGAREFVEPVGACAGPDGNVYIADTGNNRVKVLDSNRRFLYDAPLPMECWETKSVSSVEPAVAVTPKGSIVVTDAVGHSIWVVADYGKNVKQAVRYGRLGDGMGQMKEPRGVAVDPEGNLYVADSGNGRIVVLAPVD